MSQNVKHYLVEFASRYTRSHFKTLNAGSALWRAEMLLEDAQAFAELKEVSDDKGIRFGSPRSPYELFSYYAVGLVTCLEWHARSRLVDTMLFRPSFIEPSDIKNIASLAISQMLADGVTVPHLLGAATHVSSVQEYVAVFKRVFNALGYTEIIESKLRQTESQIYLHLEGRMGSLHAALADLFKTRNHLVHEIDQSVVGHYTLRDAWSPETAVLYGQAVVAAIKLIEAEITKLAPQDFPNRLEADGSPEDELENLKKAIVSIEDELSALFKQEEFSRAWSEALAANKESQNLELRFIDEADFLKPVRHLDMRRSFQVEYLKAKLSYLLLVKSEADQYPWINPTSDEA